MLQVVHVFVCVTMVCCDKMPEWIKLVFGVMVVTEDSYFVLVGCLDLLMERETYP